MGLQLIRKREVCTNPPNQEGDWLFSQTSGVPASQGHHTENNNRIFISDDSEPENNLEAEPSGLRNDFQKALYRKFPTLVMGRAAKNSFADGNRVPAISRERSRSSLSTLSIVR